MYSFFDTCIATGTTIIQDRQIMEFHIHANIRKKCNFDDTLFASSGNVIFANIRAVHLFVQKYNKQVDGTNHPEHYIKAGALHAMGLLDEIFHYVFRLYRETTQQNFFTDAYNNLVSEIGEKELLSILTNFVTEFPPRAVYTNALTPDQWISQRDNSGVPNTLIALEEMILLRHSNENPALESFSPLFTDTNLSKNPLYSQVFQILQQWSKNNPPFGPEGFDILAMIKAPIHFSPYDLKGQLEYVRTRWAALLGEWLTKILSGIDYISEEEKAAWQGGVGSGTPEMKAYSFDDISKEYERFSPDREWMPNVVLIAKSVLVWLDQLRKKYKKDIWTLDQIPNEELDLLAGQGFTGLWLIGVWERSPASARIKQICGNPEAAASAYSLYDYDIADELGGWPALENLRSRAWARGIRMASDMVPNHTGIDSKWVRERPDLFISTQDSPFPGYDFSGENLSQDPNIEVTLDNQYYAKSDCAVVFKRYDRNSHDVRYIYHGNDGTGMPWNDTAQIDFLNPQAREEVIQKILHVASNFPIIRFDAAMVLAKKHIQRLWYPEPGKGGDIASRANYAISREEFEHRIPEEFWREVVDRCAKEIPDTLLLAEAFWMMEGYFVRTLGMHRVYNSAFMNMLKREDNDKYRSTIKNTIEFDPEILKRYVNFMNNPDEETAVMQFGRGDKYFGICTMMIAMPGLPMFGHGQVEGFEEKYGMEYRRAYKEETPDQELVARHYNEIFPLMKKRYLFAGVENFLLFDFWVHDHVNENVFVWSNRVGAEKALVFFNNVYQETTGWIKTSAPYAVKNVDGSKSFVYKTLGEGLDLNNRPNRFCIFQEQRSQLWFIRTTKEICENGMFARLKGFQTQVFVNIHEIDDNKDRHYQQLYEILNGAGIPDIYMGIQNIVLKDLYLSLSHVLSKDFIQQISQENSQNAAVILSSIRPQAMHFFEITRKYLDGDFGTQDIEGIENPYTRFESKKVWKQFSRSIERLILISKTNHLSPELKIAFALNTILSSIGTSAGKNATVACTHTIIQRWCLDRKGFEILSKLGFLSEKIQKEFSHIVSVGLLSNELQSNRSISPKQFLLKIVQTEEIWNFSGIHEWDTILWYNKEKAEHVVEIASLSYYILGLTKKKLHKSFFLTDFFEKIRVKKIKNLGLEAIQTSAYKYKELVEYLDK